METFGELAQSLLIKIEALSMAFWRPEAMPFSDCADGVVQLAENSQLFQCPTHLDLLIYKENPHD